MKRSPIKRRNKARHAKRLAASFGAQAQLCRRMQCVACARPRDRHPETVGCYAALVVRAEALVAMPPIDHGSDPHHEISRGSGHHEDSSCVPLCRIHHTERHASGRRTFELKYGLDLLAIADEIRTVVQWANGRRDSTPDET